VGSWQGFPQFNVLGPWNIPLNLTILPLGTDGTAWVMYHKMDSGSQFIPNSIQQFWVTEGQGLIYCGILRNFFPATTPIRVEFYESVRNATMMKWCEKGSNCEISWTLNIINPTTIHSTMILPVPVRHLDVVLVKINSAPPPLEGPLPPPCNISIPTPLSQPSKARTKCPFEIAKIATVEKPPSLPYKHCYVVNPSVDFRLAWSTSADSESMDVALSIPSTDDRWIAVGFEPNFPGMVNADIVLGYADKSGMACVRTLYAKAFVGLPVENPTLKVRDTSVSVEDGRFFVKFTRDFVTGNHNITGNDVAMMWASGTAPADCAEPKIPYHINTRGVRAINWLVPDRNFPDFMKCAL